MNSKYKGKHHNTYPLTAAAMILLGAHTCFWCKYCHFSEGWYSGSLILIGMTVVVVYNRMITTVVFIIKLYLKRKKKKPLPSASIELDVTFKSTVLLHSPYMSAITFSPPAPSLKPRIAGQHQYDLAAWIYRESMWLRVRTCKY